MAGDVLQRDGGDQVAVEGVEGGHVADRDAEEIVDVAGHAVDFEDFAALDDGSGELVQPFRGMVAGFDLHEDGEAEADRLGFYERYRGFDDALTAEALDAAPAGGWREA